MWRTSRAFVAVFLGAMLGACGGTADARRVESLGALGCQSGADAMRRLELLFGLTLKDGNKISTAEWQSFVDAEVTPRFPERLTVLRGLRTMAHEERRHRKGVHASLGMDRMPTAKPKIDAIRSAYKAQFTQDSVMRV